MQSTRPLRLLLWHWGRRGGGPRYTMELARTLARRPGLDVHLSLSRQSELFQETDAVGLPSFHVDTYTDLVSFVLRTAALPAIRAKFLSYLRQQQIDVVYNTLDFLWGAAIAPSIRKTNARYLLAVHDAARHAGEDGPFRRWLLRRDIAAADGGVTMTDAVRTELVARHGFPADRTWTVPLGLFLDHPLGRGRSLPTDRPIRLLFFGRILPYKGLDMLIEAFAEIRKERPDVELEIWGSGDLNPYAAALAGCSGVRLEHRWLDEQEIGPVFERTDICVLPYREASQSAVIATALASGMPVVTTPIPGLVEQIAYGKAGRISPDLSPDGFAKTILDLIARPSDYMQLSRDAVAYCDSTLGWPAIGDRIEAAARQLTNLSRKSQP